MSKKPADLALDPRQSAAEDERLYLFRGATEHMVLATLRQAGWPYGPAAEMAGFLTRRRTDIPTWERLRKFMDS